MRRTVSLLAAGTVALSVTALLVASNVNAGVFSYSSNTAKQTAVAITYNLAKSSALALLSGNPPAPTSSPKHPPQQNQSEQTAATQAVPTTTNQNTTSNQTATVTVDPVTVCMQPSSQSTYTIQTAQITLQNQTTVSTTISWFWEIQVSQATTTTDTQQPGSTQNVATGASSVIIPADNSSPLLNFTGDGTSTYRFRLHIVGAANALSDWITAPQTADNPC